MTLPGKAFYRVGLTGKGMELLDAKPESLEVRRTRRQMMADAVKSGSKEVAGSAVETIVAGAVKGLRVRQRIT
jgi:hypothetical protein